MQPPNVPDERTTAELEARLAQPDLGPDAVLPPQVVVVRSAEGKWVRRLWLPVLMVLTGVAFLSYRLHAPDWIGLVLFPVSKTPATMPEPRGAAAGVAGTKPPAERPVEAATAAVPAREPVVVRFDEADDAGGDEPVVRITEVEVVQVAERALAEKEARAETEAAAERERNQARAEELIREIRTQDLVVSLGLPPKPELRPLASEVLDGIREHADRLRVEREQLERLKPQQLRQVEQQTKERRAREAQIARAKANSQRMAFRDRLKEILRTADSVPRSQAAVRILKLCGEYGTGTESPRLWPTSGQDVLLTRGKRTDLVLKLRSDGKTEPEILIELARLERGNTAARNGPRDADESLVRAAKYLLAVPVRDGETRQASRELGR